MDSVVTKRKEWFVASEALHVHNGISATVLKIYRSAFWSEREREREKK